MKMEEDFKKNQKLLKTCVSCREKHKKVLAIEPCPEPVQVPTPIPVPEPLPEPLPTQVPVPEPVPVKMLVHVPIKWCFMSGHWIKEGEEYTLHKKLTQKLIRQFHKQSAFPVHQYLTRWLRVDIRDRYSPSSE